MKRELLPGLSDRKPGVLNWPKAALYFSCVARGPNLFGGNSEELTAVAEAIGEDVPLVGFAALQLRVQDFFNPLVEFIQPVQNLIVADFDFVQKR